MLRSLGAMVLGLLLAALLSAPAVAYDEVEGPDDAASVSSGIVEPGGVVTFAAQGFQPGGAVDVTATEVSAGAVVFADTVDADGMGALSVGVQLGDEGGYTITATGAGADGAPLVLSQTVRVVAETAGGAGTVSGTDAGAGSDAGAVLGSDSRVAVAGFGGAGELASTGAGGVATIAWMGLGGVLLGAFLLSVATGRRARTARTGGS